MFSPTTAKTPSTESPRPDWEKQKQKQKLIKISFKFIIDN